MDNLTEELEKLRERNPDVALVIEAYREAEQVYKDALQAMGVTQTQPISVANASNVTISVPTTAAKERW